MADPAKKSDNVDRISLIGTVIRIVFRKEETGFTVATLDVGNGFVSVVGSIPAISEREEVHVLGYWERHPRYGMQIKAERMCTVPPSTPEGMVRYLSSGLFRGIGTKTAKRIVKAFGVSVMDVLDNHPERLCEVKGISRKRADEIASKWREKRSAMEAMVFLHSHGIGPERAVRIYRNFGDETIATVTANPYKLMEVRGIGFKIADQLAQSIGVPKNAPFRLRAGVRHVLEESAMQGHCALSMPDAVDAMSKVLDVEAELCESTICEVAEDEAEPVEVLERKGELYISLRWLEASERGVASRLLELASAPLSRRLRANLDSLNGLMASAEDSLGLRLSEEQRRAVLTALRNKVSVITGGPGVGKTTVLRALLAAVGKNTQVALCAPTGRAAKRMSEATGMTAYTMHRLLDFDPATGKFKRDDDNTLPFDMVVVDEASMVDVVLMNALLRAIRQDSSLVIVGDPDQLPAVGPGNVLKDIIASGRFPVARLSTIFRQAEKSGIVQAAHGILKGRPPVEDVGQDFMFIPIDDPDEGAQTIVKHVVAIAREGLDPIRDIQVLSPMKRGSVGTTALNSLLSEAICPSMRAISRFGKTFREGDKVIQLRNDYTRQVFNGDLGIISWIDEEKGSIGVTMDARVVQYDLDDLDDLAPAWAITIHKAQGSEFPIVFIPVYTSHAIMIARDLLYTAVTRGRQLVVLIGQEEAVRLAVRKHGGRKRITFLADRLSRPVAAF